MAEGKSKQKKVHALRQKAKVFRDSDPVTSVFMWGVNHMVREIALLACLDFSVLL